MNDIVDIAKVLGTAFSAMAISVTDLSEIMQVSQLIEQLLQIGLLIGSIIYITHKIHDIRKQKEDRAIDH
jgi:ABC-type uncharacterized transport system ATPase subunit